MANSNHRPENDGSECPRRRFLASAAISLTSLLAGSALSGCAHDETRTAADDDLNSLRQVPPKLVGYRETCKIETGMKEPRGLAVMRNATVAVVGDQALAFFSVDGQQTHPKVALTFEPVCIASGPITAPESTAGKADVLFIAAQDHVEVVDADCHLDARWQPLGDRALLTGLAVGKDCVWVADSGNRTVYRYGFDGIQTGSFGGKDPATGYGGLVVPSPHLDVLAAPDGGVFVTNLGEHRVEHHATDGKLLAQWGTASFDIDGFCGCCNPTDFALLPDGRFVTAEKGIPRVKVYSAKGTFECVVAGPDAFPSSTLGMDLAALPDGRVLVLDAKRAVIRVFSPAKASA